jgi:hypothetical protein
MTNGRVGRWRAGAALALSAVLLLHNGVDYSMETQAVAAFWALMLGLGLGERRRAEGPNAPSAPRPEPQG